MQTHGGVSRCFAEIYSHLPNNIEATIGIKKTDNEYLLSKGFKHWGPTYNRLLSSYPFSHDTLLFPIYHKIISRYCQKRMAKNHKYCEELLIKKSFDIFHPTFFDDWFLDYLGNTPFVLTIHDMIPELFPKYFRNNTKQIVMKRKLAPLASKIIAVSENTKKDIVNILKIPQEKIDVVYHGVNECKSSFSSKSPFSNPYILYVGDRFGYKNFVLFLKSFAYIIKKHKELILVCTGMPFNKEELVLIKELGLQSCIVQKYIKSDQELMNLYHHAICFVYPSEYEGFGIPILEAYQANCPVMLNKKSCFPEIAGDAALYFSMDDHTNNFGDIFIDFYNNYTTIKKQLLAKQKKRINNFSWELSASQLADIYKTII